MGNIKAIWQLFDEASAEVTKDGGAWEEYLRFAARIYKYSFDNALQIYAQNPNATMLAEKEIWENRIGRTINREHTNICVFDVMSAKPELRYLVDISDTSGADRTYPRLWRLTPENTGPLLERLQQTHHPEAASLEEYISMEAMRRIGEIRPGFYEGIKRNMDGSPLYEMDSDSDWKASIDVMIWQSAVYLMYARCGFDTGVLNGQFEDITAYNNKALLYRMGNCATIIAQDFLSECASALNQLARERREQAINQKAEDEPKPAPLVSTVKRRIADNIRKNATRSKQENPAQISLFDNMGVAANDQPAESAQNNENNFDEQVIAEIVRQGSLTENSLSRIYHYFREHTNSKDRTAFLKQEYGICGASVQMGGAYISWMANGSGIEYYPLQAETSDKKKMSWPAFAKHIQTAIDAGTYYKPEPQIEEETAEKEPEPITPKFQYGDYISLNGKIYEVLDSNPEEQKTDIGNSQFYVSPHTYIMVEAISWEELNTAQPAPPPENILPELHINDYVEYQNRKCRITRIDADHVHLQDETYTGITHPWLLNSDSVFVEAPIPEIREALLHTNLERRHSKADFFNCEIEMLSKEMEGRTFYFPYAILHSDRYLLSFAPKEEWTEQDLADGRKNAYKDYLMDVLGYSHKEALAEAEIMSEEEYERYYSADYPITIEAEFPYADKQYMVLNFDREKQEVLVRDITHDNEENLPLYEIFDIPFVYHRTQAIKDLRDVELHDFLSAPVDFINVTFGEAGEETVYTYGYVQIKDAVMYMDYTVDREWTQQDIEHGQRRSYRNYLADVMGYSDKEACSISGLLTNAEFEQLTDTFIPAADIPHTDEIINAPAEAAETEYQPTELQYSKPEASVRPEIPRVDYVYSPADEIGAGGPKVKSQANIEAIRLLNQIESENRLATAEEQKILCRYVGWGGLAEAFDPNNTAWSNEYMQLKALLSETDYESARASTLCAHYTPPEVIQEIYQALQNFGFHGGNVLDPAMGTGLFFAAMPEELRGNSRLYGYEIDEVSGRIAKQLSQNADVRIQGFETTDVPDNFFDIAVGNVPFGDYRLHDPKFNKYKFLIHDYFFVKALDKVRPSGVIAFITSKGTLDKESPELRKYLGGRADLIGAVRLPNNTFRQMANTSVTTDIIFLQKRERIVSEEPPWVNIGTDGNGIPVNAYYAENPFMMLGKMEYGTRYGENSTTDLIASADFELRPDLNAALSSLHAVIPEYDRADEGGQEETIPADPKVKNFTYTFVDDKLYYRENSVMRRMNYEGRQLERITGMCEIRDVTRKLIDAQSVDENEQIIKQLQYELNETYDDFVKNYGNISDTANERVFRDDSDYPLICSLEIYDEETKTYQKADMFTKRTIRPHVEITAVDTAADALRVSLLEKGKVDFPFMSQLYKNTPYDDLYAELHGLVYINPAKLPHTFQKDISIHTFFEEYGELDCMETADEYLSGDVRHKWDMAKAFAETNPEIFQYHADMLAEVQPPPLSAADIDVSIGVTWIENEDYTNFLYEVFQTPIHATFGSSAISVTYNRFTGAFSVRNKGRDSTSVTVTETFGTSRKTAYEIFEDTLNSRATTVYDPKEEGSQIKYVVNQKETLLAREKQDQIKQAFRNWIFEEPVRRQKYVDYYNEHFNNLRLRKYDGSFLEFQGMTEDLELRWYQKNAIARALLSNTCELLDHKVGAGKSFVMVATCMEMKRLGHMQKAIFVVPNHLTGQMGSEFLRLYPSAKILVTTKRDFEKNNRLKFVSKIATGEWDAVIIGHSQFEKIALSKERQIMTLQNQVAEIAGAIEAMSEEEGEKFTVRQMEKLKETLTEQIKELADDSKKDDLITFESLGIDYMFVDEAHYYKNCATFSKMRNVAGINQSRAKKSTDMLSKCRYMQEINNGKGVVFATGTPISNSMSEMFVMQRYLDPKELEERNMVHFDAWAAHFGETVISLELAPEGTGYRYRTRFAKFKNLPELLAMYHNFSDVITDEDLDIPRPAIRGGQIEIVTCPPSEFTLLTMMSYVERAKDIHEGKVKSWEDNMLKLTNEARHLATDIRLIDPTQENPPTSKVSMCADNVYADYLASADIKGTQIIFCDIGTPKANGEFNVYDALKEELVARGIPEDEICFVHDAKNDAQREALFAKVRSGEKRIIIGSTNKLGVGTNIQTRVYAEHDLDCPYRPSDVEQRLGRALRNGNINPDVSIRRYVSPNTFDAYMWQLVETKQRFISQIKSGKTVQRTCEDIDEAVITYAELKAVASGDERIKEKMDVDLEVSKLQMLKADYDNQRYTLQDKFMVQYPNAIAANEKRLEGLQQDKVRRDKNHSEEFMMTVDGKCFTEREEAGKRILLMAKAVRFGEKGKEIGQYAGFTLSLRQDRVWDSFETKLVLQGALSYSAELSASPHGNTMKLDNLLKSIDKEIENTAAKLEENKKNMTLAKEEYEKPFPYAEALEEKLKRQKELDAALDLGRQDEMAEEEPEAGDQETNVSESNNDDEQQIQSAVDLLPYSNLEKQNYKFLSGMFPEVICGKQDYMKFKADFHDDMYVERIGDDIYALCLFYILNGDVMREPEYTFRIDRERHAARILDWTMSSLGMCQAVYDYEDPQLYNPKLKKDLDEAFNSTLRDIEQIDYQPYAECSACEDENEL